MRIVNLVCGSAVLLIVSELAAEASTVKTTIDRLENQDHLVRKVDFIGQNQWETKAGFLLSQAENNSPNNSKEIANGSWSNLDPEEEEEPAEVLFQLQQISERDFAPNRGAPGFTMANPYGFGADKGNAYIGIGFTPTSRLSRVAGDDDGDAVMGVGIGLGDARDAVALELNYTLASFGFNRDFGTGAFNAKLHRTIATGWGVAAGYNGFLNTGDANDFEDSAYLATTKIFSTREKLNSAFSRMALTVGVGNGQFRTEDAIEDDEEGFNVFGSLAFRVARPVSGIVEWTGQDLAVGASVSPFRTLPVTFNLGLRDIAGAGDGARFVFGAGAGF